MATMVRFVSMASSAVRSPPVPPSPERCGERVVVDTAQGEPDPFGLGTVEHLAERRRRRHLRPRRAQHPRMAATGMEADLEEAGVEAGTAGGDAHVASESEVHAGPDGAPLTAASVGSGQRAARRNPS